MHKHNSEIFHWIWFIIIRYSFLPSASAIIDRIRFMVLFSQSQIHIVIKLWIISGNCANEFCFDTVNPNFFMFNYLQPIFTRDWELHVSYRVHGSKGQMFGDGMAIWYTKKRMELGPVFGSRDLFTGLGIFLDTYSNHNGVHTVSGHWSAWPIGQHVGL